MRSSSSCSWAPSSRTRLLASTTAMGSTKIVSPDPELSCTIPGTAERDDAFTASTGRPPRSVVNVSCRCDRSRTASCRRRSDASRRAAARRRRMEASSGGGRVEQPAAGVEGAVRAASTRRTAPRSGAAKGRGEARGAASSWELHGLAQPRCGRATVASTSDRVLGVEKGRRGRGGGRLARTSNAPPGPPTPRSRRRSASSVSARRGRPPRTASAEGASTRGEGAPAGEGGHARQPLPHRGQLEQLGAPGIHSPGDRGGGPQAGRRSPWRATPGIGLGTGIPTEGS